MLAAEQRAQKAARRDLLARRRDESADERDRIADERDRRVAELLASDHPAVEDLSRLLVEAAADRDAAAADRRMAGEDRSRAEEARIAALAALEDAHFDELTGAHRRGFGEEMIRAEIERARRGDGRLALVMLDVDGLKRVNDERGHLAGDEMLRDVAAALQANVRSYEPVVRLGGDEFAFTLAGADCSQAMERCDVIQDDLDRKPSQARITVGCADLSPGDDFTDLLWRADTALVKARRERRRGAESPRFGSPQPGLDNIARP